MTEPGSGDMPGSGDTMKAKRYTIPAVMEQRVYERETDANQRRTLTNEPLLVSRTMKERGPRTMKERDIAL